MTLLEPCRVSFVSAIEVVREKRLSVGFAGSPRSTQLLAFFETIVGGMARVVTTWRCPADVK